MNCLDKLGSVFRNYPDMKPRIPSVLITFALVCFALSPKVQAVVPAPDGGYPNFTTAEGTKALFSLTTGSANTAVGWYSLFGTSSGSFNTAIGYGALDLNTADNNTAIGAAALLLNSTGTNNTANGVGALVFNNTGEGNTATGAFALYSNTEGQFNTANGEYTLYFNTTGERNTAIGDSALYRNTTGNRNAAVGNAALLFNTSGADNTAIGAGALFLNNADTNTAIGADALSVNTTGDGNTANGFQALFSNTTGDFNTAYGLNALSNNTTGSGNIALGGAAGDQLITGDDNIDIGNNGQFPDNRTIRIGQVQTRTFIAGIRGITTGTADAIPVLIDSFGQLGTMSSARRFKHNIKLMDQTSEAILALKPVMFHYKSDNTNTPQFGLIAEEVAEVNPDLVVRDESGEIYTVRYDAVNAMLLNEFLKEHRKVEELTKDFQATVAQLTARLDDQAAQIQKVSAQLEASKPAPQMVNNP